MSEYKIYVKKTLASGQYVMTEKEWERADLVNEIKDLQAQLATHRWIPVSERLPEEGGYYQVIREQNGWPTTRKYWPETGWESSDTVTHWKDVILPPLPDKEKSNG